MTEAEPLARLLAELGPMQRALIAFSGGVDSSLLLDACIQALGPDNVLAVTLDVPYVARAEIKNARCVANNFKAKHLFLARNFSKALRSNPEDRCYLCKRDLFTRLRALAAKNGFRHVAEGSNQDDLREHRPGRRAGQELGIASPLLAAGLDKAAVRDLARRRGLAIWDKPAQSCLLTRFPHGTLLDLPAIRRLEAAEDFLRRQGITDVRVRCHAKQARIEIAQEHVEKLPHDATLRAVFTKLGYDGVTVDPEGYRHGHESV